MKLPDNRKVSKQKKPLSVAMTIGPFSADHESKNKDQQCNGFTVKMAAKFTSCKIFLLFLAWQLYCRQCLASNKALGRNITANVTCGSPPELYYKIWQGMFFVLFAPHSRTCRQTNAKAGVLGEKGEVGLEPIQ